MTDAPYDPRDTLREAAEYISEHGWLQGGFVDDDDEAVCAMGALYKSLGVSELYFDSVIPVAGQAIKANLCTNRLGSVLGHSNIPEWNDDPARTAEDVILAFKEAANRDA